RSIRAKMRALSKRSETYEHEFRLCLPNGSQRWLSAHADIRSNRIVGVCFDITQRKSLEREAVELAERLISLQEEERQRIAQLLHDSTAQHLVATSLNLMHLRPKDGLDGDKLMLWNHVEASMAEALREIRALSYLMHPLELDAEGLNASLSRYVCGHAARSGLIVRLRSTAKVDKLPLAVQRSLFRIVQEALANVHCHARATQVLVGLRALAGRTHLIITDNGCMSGAQEHALMRPTVDLYGIRARAHQFGGVVKIRTGVRGTR